MFYDADIMLKQNNSLELAVCHVDHKPVQKLIGTGLWTSRSGNTDKTEVMASVALVLAIDLMHMTSFQ